MKRGSLLWIGIVPVPFIPMNSGTMDCDLYVYDENFLADGSDTYTESDNPFNGAGIDGIVQIEFSAENSTCIFPPTVTPNFPYVTTPFETNITILLNFTDIDSAIGITDAVVSNDSINIVYFNGDGNIHISVSFQGVSDALSQIDIWEIDFNSQVGNYSIQFNTMIISLTNTILMNVYINWTNSIWRSKH